MDEARLRELAEEYMSDRESQSQLTMFLARAEDARRTLSVADLEGLSEPDVVRVFGGLSAYGDELIARETINKLGLQYARDYLRRVVETAPIDLGPEQLKALVSTPGFGASVATELLGALEPSRHWHLNDTVKRGLRRIGVGLSPPGLPKSGVEVHRYFALKPQIDAVRDVLGDVFGKPVDLYTTTRFLIEIGRGYKGDERERRRVWWVNHNLTYESNRDGGFIWARKESADGRSVAHHRRLEEMREGDVTVHNPGGRIAAIGLVTAEAVDDTLPGDEGAGSGWRVAVEYYEFAQPIELDTQMLTDLRALGIAGGPIGGDARINQGYAFNFSVEGLHILRRASNAEWPGWAEELIPIGAPTVRYWKVSPGQSASHWEVLRQQGCMGIGGNEIGDLSEIDPTSKAELRGYYEALDTRTDRSWTPQYAAGQYWPLLREIAKGDRIVAYGSKTVLDIGTVTGEYCYDDDADAYPHRRPVSWDGIEPLQLDTLPPDVADRLQRNSTMFEITEEQYRAIMEASVGKPPIAKPIQVIQTYLSANGFHFGDWDVASFYTALQTKGFVILSGISGTGKTKLAQQFAAMLPGLRGARQEERDVLSTTVQPYMLRYGRMCIPRRASAFIEWPDPDQKLRVTVSLGGAQESCALSTYRKGNVLVLGLKGEVRDGFNRQFREGDTVFIDIETDKEGSPELIDLRPEANVVDLGTSGGDRTYNSLFIPVRPDWRDSKSLLGYYNPLTQEYNWAEFLRFLMRATRNFASDTEPTVAWFVLLDEMNLARVEYYFADLLSVLESGRDKGWTREPLRCEYPDDAAGELPPREIHLPPNLYVIGTVNVDETTHAFSPKVLDRAFTIRITDVDFATYPPDYTDEAEPSASEKQGLLNEFTRGGRFAVIEKLAIAEFVAQNPDVRDRLQELNRHLRVYDMHFGYRVFDEIVSFLEAAEQSGSFDDLAQALDAAVLMKVLPKFHGSRGKLEAPLVALYAWCINPDEAEPRSLEAEIEGLGSEVDVVGMLAAKDIVYQKTAQRVRQMLRDLYADGFTAFG